MKNRPLLSVCLMVLCIIASMVVWGRERFIKELRPSPIERYAAEGDNITICGKIYRQEQKENCRMIYLKENSIYSNSKKFQESKIIIYTNSSQKLHIGNQIKVCGKVSFYEEARNPGNFDQKFYYQKQGIHGKVRSDDIQITDYKRNKLKDRLEKFRMNWQKMLQREMGERDDDDKIRLNQRKPSKYKGLRRFGPEKNLQRINKFMKERPIFYKNLIQMKENIRFYLRCFYCITKVMILQFNSENRTELARNG